MRVRTDTSPVALLALSAIAIMLGVAFGLALATEPSPPRPIVRRVSEAAIVWAPAQRTCSIKFTIDGRPGFAVVPDQWCEGLR